MSSITQDMISFLDQWRHTGFNVFFGPYILPRYEKSMENLARHIIPAHDEQPRPSIDDIITDPGYPTEAYF